MREVIIISIAMLKGHCCREASHCAVHLSSAGRLLFGSLHLSEVDRRTSGHLHLGEAHRGSGCLHRLERTYGTSTIHLLCEASVSRELRCSATTSRL